MSSNSNPVVDRPFNQFNRVQLEQQISKQIRKKMGFARDPRPIEIPGLQRLYIFNVSDKEYRWHQVGFPWYVVPACTKDGDHSAPIYELGKEDTPGIAGIVNYEFLEIDKTKWAQHLGEEVAMEIMSIGAGKPPQTNLENYGLFRSWSNPPKPSEVAAAKARFVETLEAIVRDGNDIHAQGEKKGLDGQMFSSEHRWAARLLGQSEPWARNARQMVTCPGCGNDMPAVASLHSERAGGCGYVVDPQRAFDDGMIDERKFKQVMVARERKSKPEESIN
jgi:hypothetical protein